MELLLSLLTVALLSCWGQVEAGEGLGGALDSSLTCRSEVEYSPGTIVDIKQSVTNGAELLLGKWVLNQETCLSQCCAMKGCDLALFKSDGVSKNGNNCYLVHCGSPNNCVMVALGSFVSMTLKNYALSREGEGSSKAPEQQLHAHTKTGSESTESKGTSSQPPQQIPRSSTATHFSSTPAITTTAPPLVESSVASHDLSTSKPSGVPSSKQVETLPTTPDVSTSPGQVNEQAEEPKAPNPGGGGENKRVKAGDGECGVYGCDGSGVVAIVVVAAVCVAIVIVVGAVLLKKVVEERRRKKFRNVDYLINGMYT